jgi:hypothetical protein
MSKLKVVLDFSDFLVGVNAATSRMVASVSKGLNPASTYKRTMPQRFHEELLGALGEIAFGKASGKYFVPRLNTFHETADCQGDIEVRATDLCDGRLIVRDNDDDGRKFVLAIVSDNPKESPQSKHRTIVRLMGWITGEDARQQQWLTNPNGDRPAWFVPQGSLNDMDDVVAIPEEC